MIILLYSHYVDLPNNFMQQGNHREDDISYLGYNIFCMVLQYGTYEHGMVPYRKLFEYDFMDYNYKLKSEA